MSQRAAPSAAERHPHPHLRAMTRFATVLFRSGRAPRFPGPTPCFTRVEISPWLLHFTVAPAAPVASGRSARAVNGSSHRARVWPRHQSG